MDNFEYLNKISQSSKPTKTAKSSGPFGNLSNSSIFKIAIGGIAIFLLLMMGGNFLSSLNHKTSDLTKQLYVRSTNLNTVLSTNNKLLKSSQLRALGLSLSTVLTNSTRELQTYLSERSEDSKTALVPDTKTAQSEKEALENLQNVLTTARLNGILDRTYSNQINLQISLLMSMISELGARAKDEKLQEILTTFYSNLAPIHQSFEEYSNTAS